jgi:hypothetical protein
VADLVYVPTQEGVLYPGVVLDVWRRRVVGWAMRPDARAELVEMALWRRRPAPALVRHSDRGAQDTSLEVVSGSRICQRLPPPQKRGKSTAREGIRHVAPKTPKLPGLAYRVCARCGVVLEGSGRKVCPASAVPDRTERIVQAGIRVFEARKETGVDPPRRGGGPGAGARRCASA